MDRKITGSLGEKLAQDFLRKKGYRILETNYRCPLGEIDIVALWKDCLVFAEVRTRSNRNYGLPEESLSPSKLRHMQQSACFYHQSHPGLPESWRIDLVAVEINSSGGLKRIELLENILEEF